MKPQDAYYDEKDYYGTYQEITFTEQQEYYNLLPNTYYVWYNCIPYSIVFLEAQTDNVTHEYIFRIDVNENLSNYTLVMTIGGYDGLSWANDDVPDFEPGYSYEISVINSYATYNKFESRETNV